MTLFWIVFSWGSPRTWREHPPAGLSGLSSHQSEPALEPAPEPAPPWPRTSYGRVFCAISAAGQEQLFTTRAEVHSLQSESGAALVGCPNKAIRAVCNHAVSSLWSGRLEQSRHSSRKARNLKEMLLLLCNICNKLRPWS